MIQEPLSRASIDEALAALPGWTLESDRLVKTFVLANFRDAIGFVVRLSFEAEQVNHHPELGNVYNRVTVALTTHDAGDKVTRLDVELAGRVERLFSA